MTETMSSNVVPLRWNGTRETGHLEMLDQRLLPAQEVWLPMKHSKTVADGIADMVIRGAPAIGIATAFGMALGIRDYAQDPMVALENEAARLIEQFMATRPTAVNLRWALQRFQAIIDDFDDTLDHLVDALFDEAHAIFEADRENNRTLGRNGAALFDGPTNILTHCNTGGLATGGFGTALGVIRALDHENKLNHVWIGETRPYLQGARLTTWECAQDNLDGTLITDSMAAHFMQRGEVDAVIVGTDRVAANGDVANKIGTYGLAILCRHHNIPFYVASPLSTIDLDTPTGTEIPIEERSPDEVTHLDGKLVAPKDFPAASPAFDVTPADLVTAIITEAGVVKAPYLQTLAELL